MRCCDCEFRNRCDETEKVLTSFVKCYKRDRLLKEQKTQTNADKIRSMTDEELAVFLDEFSGRCVDCEELGPDNDCPIHRGVVFCQPCDIMDWLKQPADEE
mgnify:CR=1 FL=1